jgi:hypothetical protein
MMRAIEIFYTGFGDGVKPHEYGVWVHQDDHIAVEAERDALRAEVDRLKMESEVRRDKFWYWWDKYQELKAQRDADIAAAVEAAKAEMYIKAEAIIGALHPMVNEASAMRNIFGTWRPTTDDSSADEATK